MRLLLNLNCLFVGADLEGGASRTSQPEGRQGTHQQKNNSHACSAPHIVRFAHLFSADVCCFSGTAQAEQHDSQQWLLLCHLQAVYVKKGNLFFQSSKPAAVKHVAGECDCAAHFASTADSLE
jgi:hypothetical protein